jgi:tetrahydrodipicolinate N-succinyltransferase
MVHIIKAGIRIGNGVIVAAHAVVTKDVPDFAVVAGNPAKVVRYRFDQELQIKILESEWWSYSPTILKNFSMINIEHTLNVIKETQNLSKFESKKILLGSFDFSI